MVRRRVYRRHGRRRRRAKLSTRLVDGRWLGLRERALRAGVVVLLGSGREERALVGMGLGWLRLLFTQYHRLQLAVDIGSIVAAEGATAVHGVRGLIDHRAVLDRVVGHTQRRPHRSRCFSSVLLLRRPVFVRQLFVIRGVEIRFDFLPHKPVRHRLFILAWIPVSDRKKKIKISIRRRSKLPTINRRANHCYLRGGISKYYLPVKFCIWCLISFYIQHS